MTPNKSIYDHGSNKGSNKTYGSHKNNILINNIILIKIIIFHNSLIFKKISDCYKYIIFIINNTFLILSKRKKFLLVFMAKKCQLFWSTGVCTPAPVHAPMCVCECVYVKNLLNLTNVLS